MDDFGRERFVDFAECNRNWKRFLVDSEDFPLITRETDLSESFGVGWRRSTGKPPFVEFFCDPHVRIEFPRRWPFHDADADFRRLHRQVASAGWSTLELG